MRYYLATKIVILIKSNVYNIVVGIYFYLIT